MSISTEEMLFLIFSISFVARKIEILIYDESSHRGTLLSHPRHAYKYQMRSEISLNFSVNSVTPSIAASTVFGG